MTDISAELRIKRERVLHFLESQNLDAVLLSRHENIAWITAGKVDIRIGVLRETGPASLLLTRNDACYLTTNNEAARLADEEFAGADWNPVVKPWYASDLAATVKEIVPGNAVGADTPVGSFRPLNLQPLRLELTESEMERYRWLGRNAAEVTTDVLRKLRPGMTESQMRTALGQALLERDITPSVYLTAVDDRIRRYRHAVPRAGVLERFGMLNFCARRWGLAVSMTRYVYFGEMPAELEEKFGVVTRVNAALQAATREGRTADELFSVAKQAYAAEGFPAQETMHHQGGATGYAEREWVARPGGTEVCRNQQAFAWNPSLDGAKVEDTILLHNGAIEVITSTPQLPATETHLADQVYRSADVLRVA